MKTEDTTAQGVADKLREEALGLGPGRDADLLLEITKYLESSKPIPKDLQESYYAYLQSKYQQDRFGK